MFKINYTSLYFKCLYTKSLRKHQINLWNQIILATIDSLFLRPCIHPWIFTFQIRNGQSPPWIKNQGILFNMYKNHAKSKKRDDFLLPKSSLFFLKPWMNEQKISRILFVHPLKICEQYGFIQSCSYKSKALNRPWTIQLKK